MLFRRGIILVDHSRFNSVKEPAKPLIGFRDSPVKLGKMFAAALGALLSAVDDAGEDSFQSLGLEKPIPDMIGEISRTVSACSGSISSFFLIFDPLLGRDRAIAEWPCSVPEAFGHVVLGLPRGRDEQMERGEYYSGWAANVHGRPPIAFFTLGRSIRRNASSARSCTTLGASLPPCRSSHSSPSFQGA